MRRRRKQRNPQSVIYSLQPKDPKPEDTFLTPTAQLFSSTSCRIWGMQEFRSSSISDVEDLLDFETGKKNPSCIVGRPALSWKDIGKKLQHSLEHSKMGSLLMNPYNLLLKILKKTIKTIEAENDLQLHSVIYIFFSC